METDIPHVWYFQTWHTKIYQGNGKTTIKKKKKENQQIIINWTALQIEFYTHHFAFFHLFIYLFFFFLVFIKLDFQCTDNIQMWTFQRHKLQNRSYIYGSAPSSQFFQYWHTSLFSILSRITKRVTTPVLKY